MPTVCFRCKPTSAIVLTRHLWWVLGAATVASTANYLGDPAGSWHFVDIAARTSVAFGSPGGGFHLDHSHPELQVGPVTVLASVPFTALPTAAVKVGAVGVTSAAGLLVLRGLAALLPAAAVGVVAVVVALRVASDPATWNFYTAGPVVGTALLDLARIARGPRCRCPSLVTTASLRSSSGGMGPPRGADYFAAAACHRAHRLRRASKRP